MPNTVLLIGCLPSDDHPSNISCFSPQEVGSIIGKVSFFPTTLHERNTVEVPLEQISGNIMYLI